MELTDETSKHLHEEDTLTREEATNSEDRIAEPVLHDALDQERELYQDLAGALPLGIYRLRVYHDAATREDRWSSKDNPPYKIEFVNDRLFKILAIDKAAFIMNPGILNNYIYEEDKPEFIRKNIEANIHTTPFVWEGRLIGNGHLIWTHFESIPRVLENNDILWTGFFEDISERKRAEEELQQKNKELYLLNAEKDKFFSIIAHDLRSPFNSIIGFSGILLDKIDQNEKDNAAIKDYAEIIRNSSQRAMNLLFNLMQWSQTQTGRIEFNPEDFNLSALIDEIIQLYELEAKQKDIQISHESLSRVYLFADKAMISTILRNLISNALKFTYKGGQIKITTTEIANGIIISVKDTGVGMIKAVMDRIFHIDSSYSSPDLNGNKGTGLGLVLCKEFAEKHQGSICLESEPGVGTTFHVTLPKKKERGKINDFRF